MAAAPSMEVVTGTNQAFSSSEYHGRQTETRDGYRDWTNTLVTMSPKRNTPALILCNAVHLAANSVAASSQVPRSDSEIKARFDDFYTDCGTKDK